MLANKSGFKSAQTRFSLLLLEDGEFFLDVRSSPRSTIACACINVACVSIRLLLRTTGHGMWMFDTMGVLVLTLLCCCWSACVALSRTSACIGI